jgi:hypothetical protein
MVVLEVNEVTLLDENLKGADHFKLFVCSIATPSRRATQIGSETLFRGGKPR